MEKVLLDIVICSFRSIATDIRRGTYIALRELVIVMFQTWRRNGRELHWPSLVGSGSHQII